MTKPHQDSPRIAPWALAIIGFWTLAAALLPVVKDEAYYGAWARDPALGYFDHPPLVALIAGTGTWADGSALAARIGTILVGALTLVLALRFFRIVGLASRQAQWTALLAAHFNVLGLAFGVITTPDTGLMLAWVLALSEAALALKGRDRRWLTAGAATGLGLLSKYTMMLMGPVFLWALLRATRRDGGQKKTALRSPWPYAGGLVALLVFAPNILWNAQNDWITFRFQLRHGFAMDRPELGVTASLPRAEQPAPDGLEVRIAEPFRSMEGIEESEERKPRIYDDVLAALNRYVGFYGSQIALWGGLLAAFAVAWRTRRDADGDGLRADRIQLDPATTPLVQAATIVPLAVFGLLSLGSKVEANWSAMYIFGAAAWLAPHLARASKALTRGALANLAIGLILVLHAHWQFLPVRPHKDRLLKETHGYAELAASLVDRPGPKFAESYQMVAMTRFHQPRLDIGQWPGVTRDSEYVRTPERLGAAASAVARSGFFWLVLEGLPPPRLPGFAPVELSQLRDCVGMDLQVISSLTAQTAPETRCRHPIHSWYLARYETKTPGTD